MDRLDGERRALAEEACGMAGSIAGRYARIFPEHAEDFRSSAYWGAVKAAASYDPSDNDGAWSRWSNLHIKGEVKAVLRRLYVQRRVLWKKDILEEIVDDSGPEDHAEAIDAVEEMMKLLPEKHARLCRLVYVEGMSPTEAAGAMGFTRFHCCKLHQEALAILRREVA